MPNQFFDDKCNFTMKDVNGNEVTVSSDELGNKLYSISKHINARGILYLLDNMCNGGTISRTQINDELPRIHRYLQQEIFGGFILPVLEAWAHAADESDKGEGKFYDQRNMLAVRGCQTMLKAYNTWARAWDWEIGAR